MKKNTELDGIVAGLARHFPVHADSLLDLRWKVSDPEQAGACIKAYFDLLEDAPDRSDVAGKLFALKRWLEGRLGILVLDAGRSVCLETLPLGLEDGTDLASFCHRKMALVRNDRCHAAREIRLEISFLQGRGLAAG